MKQPQPNPIRLSRPDTGAPSTVELRHLRYFVALAEAGSFTRAAERMSIAQPTLSQQIRRLEQLVGAPLLQRRRAGVQLTKAGTMLLDASRDVLSLVHWGISQTRQAAGLEQRQLRMVLPPGLPDTLAVQISATLRSAAGAADADIVWLERSLDAEFSLIRQRQADAGLGWLTDNPDTLPLPLDVMRLGEFEPDVWVPAAHPAARSGVISVGELARMVVIYWPRRVAGGTYDAWARVLRAEDPDFEFTDLPFGHSLPLALAFAAFTDPPAAVLSMPARAAGTSECPVQLPRVAGAWNMARVRPEGRPLTATAALVWNGDLPRPLQRILLDTADGFGAANPSRVGAGTLYAKRPRRLSLGDEFAPVGDTRNSQRMTVVTADGHSNISDLPVAHLTPTGSVNRGLFRRELNARARREETPSFRYTLLR